MNIVTTIAQIVNFLIFVAVLYYLLYRPVKRIMQARKDEMERDLREAEKKLAEAEALRLETEKRAEELEASREKILKDARDQAEAHRKETLKQAEQQARERLERFRRVMEQERSDLLEKVADELRETIISVSGAVLSDASERLAERGIERLEELLSGMPADDLDNARKALAESGNRVAVRAAGSLDEAQQKRLKELLGGKLGIEGLELEVEEAPELLAGIEVTMGHIVLSADWRRVVDDELKTSTSGANDE